MPYITTVYINGGETLASEHASRRAAEHEARHHGHGATATRAVVERDGVPIAAWAWDRPACRPDARWVPVVAS